MNLSILEKIVIYGGGILLGGVAVWMLFRIGSAAVLKSWEDYQNKKRKGESDGQSITKPE